MKSSSGPISSPVAGLFPWSVRAWRRGAGLDEESLVVVEEPLAVSVDDRAVAVLMRTPGMDKQLAVGYCLGEGIIPTVSDIGTVHHCGRDVPDEAAEPSPEARNRVEIRLVDPSRARYMDQPARLVRSGCGRSDPLDMAGDIPPIDDGFVIRESALRATVRSLAASQERYRAAGGIHAAGVFDAEGERVVVCEDVGPHDAVNKALGYCAMRGVPLGDKVLLCTGRASYDLVTKGARLAVAVVASLSSPTSLAVELAEHLNMTLIGYVRADRFTVYTRPKRIVGL